MLQFGQFLHSGWNPIKIIAIANGEQQKCAYNVRKYQKMKLQIVIKGNIRRLQLKLQNYTFLFN